MIRKTHSIFKGNKKKDVGHNILYGSLLVRLSLFIANDFLLENKGFFFSFLLERSEILKLFISLSACQLVISLCVDQK